MALTCVSAIVDFFVQPFSFPFPFFIFIFCNFLINYSICISVVVQLQRGIKLSWQIEGKQIVVELYIPHCKMKFESLFSLLI